MAGPRWLGVAPCAPSRSLDLRVHLSHCGHGLNAQRRRGDEDAVSFPDMNHEPGDDVPDVMAMFHMGTAVEDVCASQLFGHLGNQREQESGHGGLVLKISQLGRVWLDRDAKTVQATAAVCPCPRATADQS